jgi:copper transport outer membrane protein MctB
MFDLRYHVASLAAVFLALVIGILVGVGIADRGVREDALRNQVAVERGRREQAEDEVGLLKRQQAATQDFVTNSYGALMSKRLDGMQIALVFVGSVDDDIRSSVQKAVSDADGRVSAMRALKLPVDRRALQSALAGRSLIARYAGDDGLKDLGRDLGKEFVHGVETPLWNAVGNELVEEQDGRLNKPVDGVVVARTTRPQRGATGNFLNGLYTGLADAGVPGVGVENSDSSTTAVRVFRRHGLSSVDDLEQPTGRLALVLLLAGGEEGQYGLREDDDALMPSIEPFAPSG